MPNLTFTTRVATQGVTFVVYAPFGTDPALSRYRVGEPPADDIRQHPLVRSLHAVAAAGTHVAATIDAWGDYTWELDIEAGAGATLRRAGKQRMEAPETLAALLLRARERHAQSALVLALEGHGAGYLPHLDRDRISYAACSDGGVLGHLTWRHDERGNAEPVDADGQPVVAMGSPLLPVPSPLVPSNHLPMSAWALAAGLRAGLGGSRLGVLHLDNCFSFAVELLHTIAPHADFAAGYMNYNFFSGGLAYPAVFQALQRQGTMSTAELARAFVKHNEATLARLHPTAGGIIKLSRMQGIGQRIDALAQALSQALDRGHAVAADRIRQALKRARHYDTVDRRQLAAPDELVDIASFARELSSFAGDSGAVATAAERLAAALTGIKVYGTRDTPWIEPEATWDFSGHDLSLNILCPDPLLDGLWDWRSAFYLQGPRPWQPQVIGLLGGRDPWVGSAWVRFIIDYHARTDFVGLRPAAIPEFPLFNPHAQVP